jgi:hypothetical protein
MPKFYQREKAKIHFKPYWDWDGINIDSLSGSPSKESNSSDPQNKGPNSTSGSDSTRKLFILYQKYPISHQPRDVA